MVLVVGALVIGFSGVPQPWSGLVHRIETQAPQPRSQHSYRFRNDWEYLEKLLDAGE